MSETSNMLYRAHHESQEKYTYYLLGLTAVGICFIIVNNQSISINLSYIPLGLSVVLLSVSFLCGLRHLEYVDSIMYSNIDLIKVQEVWKSTSQINPLVVKTFVDGIKEAMEKNSKKAQGFSRWQSRTMILGMLVYFSFYVIKAVP